MQNIPKKSKRHFIYITHAYSVWDCDGHGYAKAESAHFENTEAGWKQAQKWMREYSDKYWNVTLTKARI